MNTTINISLPTRMYNDAKEYMKLKQYPSFSELIRDIVRQKIYTPVTVNGFTPAFEQIILDSANEPVSSEKPWENIGDIHEYFKKLKTKNHDNNRSIGKI